MFSHIMIGSNDIARSKKFYDALFTAIGAQPATADARGRLAYSHNSGRFMVTTPIDGSDATHANGGTIGFPMKDAAHAQANGRYPGLGVSALRRASSRAAGKVS